MLKGHVVKIYTAAGGGWLISIAWEDAAARPESASCRVWAQQLTFAAARFRPSSSRSFPCGPSEQWMDCLRGNKRLLFHLRVISQIFNYGPDITFWRVQEKD